MPLTRIIFQSVIVTLCLYFCGCSFSPDNEFISPIIPPDLANVEINSPGFTDPFNLVEPTQFHFSIDNLNAPIEDFNVKLNTMEIMSGSGATPILFSLNPHAMQNGTHHVTITVNIRAGNGSVASQLGIEKYQIAKSFSVLVDKVPPSEIGPLTASLEEGKLTLRWNRADKSNFSFTLKRYGNYGQMPDIELSPDAVMYIEEGYVGGTMNFQLVWQNQFYNQVAGSANFTIDPLEPHISVEDNVVYVSWPEPLKIGDATSLNMFGPGDQYHTYPFEAQLMAIDTLVMGEHISLTFTIASNTDSKMNYIEYTWHYSTPNLAWGEIIPFANHFLVIGNGMTRYDFSSLEMEEHDPTIIAPIAITRSGSKGIAFRMYNSTQPQFYQFDPFNLTSYSTIDAVPLIGQYAYLSNYTLSENNLLTGTYYPPPTYGLQQTIIDLSGPTVNYNYTPDPELWKFDLSNSGLFRINTDPLKIDRDLYQLVAGSWVKIGKLPLTDETIYFDQHETKIIALSKSDIKIFPLNGQPTYPDYYTPSVTISYATLVNKPLAGIPQFDRLTDHIYFETITDNHSTLYVFDSNTFLSQGQCVGYLDPTYYYSKHTYSNGYHFLNTGFVEKVK